MDREEAINYLRSSGMSDEQIQSVCEGLLERPKGHLEPARTYCGWKEEIRPKGKWKKIGEDYYNWSNHNVIKCSICGYSKDIPAEKTPNFCENCGADMRVKYELKEAE